MSENIPVENEVKEVEETKEENQAEEEAEKVEIESTQVEEEEEEEEEEDEIKEKEEKKLEEEEEIEGEGDDGKFTALVFGSTGACGKSVLNTCITSKHCKKVYSIVRKINPLMANKEKVEQIVWEDFEKYLIFKDPKDIPKATLEAFKDVNVVFSCLGISKGHAPTYKIYEHVNLLYPVQIGRICEVVDSCDFHYLISSQGANHKSSFSYMKLKGQSEVDINKLNIKYVVNVRPSLLLAERKKKKFSEELAKFFVPVANFLGFTDMSINVLIVGRGMVHHFEELWKKRVDEKRERVRILVETAELKDIVNKNSKSKNKK